MISNNVAFLDEPVQPPFKLRNSKCCSVSSLIVIEYSSHLQNSLIRLHICAGWSEPLLVAHATLLEISCCGSNMLFNNLCPYPANIFLSAYYACCIFLNALQNRSITMNPDQTAPLEQSDLGSDCLHYRVAKYLSRREADNTCRE